MNDFDYDIVQKKRIAKGYHAKKKGSKSRLVKLPSDNLTAAEIKNMERVIAVYKIGKPVSWEEFKSYSQDVQQQYLEWLRDNIGATAGMLDEMFGLKKGGFSNWLWLHKMTGVLQRNYLEKNHKRFKKWLKSDIKIVEEKEIKPPVEKKEIKPKENPVLYNLIASCNMTLEGSAAQIGETIYQIFKDQKVKVVVTLGGKQEESLKVNDNAQDEKVFENLESDSASAMVCVGTN